MLTATATWADACARQRPGHELLRHADTNNELIDEVITYQADRGNFAQQPEHLQRVSDDEQAPPAKRPRSSHSRAPKQKASRTEALDQDLTGSKLLYRYQERPGRSRAARTRYGLRPRAHAHQHRTPIKGAKSPGRPRPRRSPRPSPTGLVPGIDAAPLRGTPPCTVTDRCASSMIADWIASLTATVTATHADAGGP